MIGLKKLLMRLFSAFVMNRRLENVQVLVLKYWLLNLAFITYHVFLCHGHRLALCMNNPSWYYSIMNKRSSESRSSALT